MKFQKWIPRGGHAGFHVLLQGGIDPLCAAVLSARGITTAEEAATLLDDSEGHFHDPFLLLDMDKAVARIRRALTSNEPIAVYGDYDVDGITATALLTSCLRSMGGNVTPYIPDRIEEGYGLNIPAIERMAHSGIKLIVTVDCGVTAVNEVIHARTLGIDVVVTDHHQCKEILPDAVAVVDPRQSGCPYPFKELAGVGVALKLAVALAPAALRASVMEEYLDLAAVGTVADVMSLTDENRPLVRRGLNKLSRTNRPGLSALLHETGVDQRPISTVTVGYILAPRINAAGRMERAGVALELLLTEDPIRGSQLVSELCSLNRERQSIELSIFEQCISLLNDNPDLSSPSIVLANEGWHQGVVGIVASRLADRYSCPAFMICLDKGKGKGSCRSFGGFNLFAALEQCSDLLEGFGGHEMAAGFTILEENIPAFKRRIDELVSSHAGGQPMETVLYVDVPLEDPSLLSLPHVESLSRLEPFGSGNPKPIFSLTASVVSCSDVGNGRHLKLRLRACSKTMDAIFFSVNSSAAGIVPGDRIDVAFTPLINEFRNTRTVQLQLCDLRPSLTRAQTERLLYGRFRSGDTLTPQEARTLLPEREDFAAIWKYLVRACANSPLEDTELRIYKLVSRALPPQCPHIRTAVCLVVMDELGLISVQQSEGRLSVTVNRTTGKVDLEASRHMLRLRNSLDEKKDR